jgi:hypothetical protein
VSEAELLAGEIAAALATGNKAVALAERASDPSGAMLNRTVHADAVLAAGEWKAAKSLFADAERRQQRMPPYYPLLYSLQGFRYCDLLLSHSQIDEALDRSTRNLQWTRVEHNVRDIALHVMILGRAHLALALETLGRGPLPDSAQADAGVAAARLSEAVEGLRASGQNDFLARGLLARAAFRRAVGDWEGAARDLDEAQEIAEPGPMRLYLCDCSLERARLALARLEAFAPLNGLVAPSPSPPAPPDAAAAAGLREEARDQLDVARKLIAECGYHRRDQELAELDAVLAGRRRFADLPLRV